MIAVASAQLTWSAPLELGNYANLSLIPAGIRAPDGTQIIAFSRDENGARRNYLQAYNAQNQALWDEPLALGKYANAARYCLTSLGEIVIFAYYELGGSYGYYMNRFNLQGEQIGDPDIEYFSRIITELFIVPDNAGGIHLLAEASQDLVYQYVTPAGALLYSPDYGGDIDGLFLEGNNNLFVKQALAMNDGSLLISYAYDYRETLLCFDKNIQLHFRIQGTETEPHNSRFSLRNDGGFYVVWTSNAGIRIQSCDPQGDFLWTDPLCMASAYCFNQFITDDQDRLLFCWWSGDDLKAQGLDQEGDLSWQDGGVPIFKGSNDYNDLFFYSDGSRGYYIIRLNENGFNKSKTVSYLNSDGTLRPWQNTLISEERYYGEPFHLARVDDGSLQVYYYCLAGQSALIAYNEIDANGLSLYGSPGLTIQVSGYGLIKEMNLERLGPNRALAIWLSSGPDYDHWSTVQYNLVDPVGGLVFAEPIQITTERSLCSDLTTYPTEDGGLMAVWRIEYIYYAQKIDANGQIQWAEPKQLLDYQGYNDVRFSCFNNSLYAVIAGNQAGAIYLQRFIDGEPVWSGAGKPVAIPNPGYPGNGLKIAYFNNAYLIWGQTFSGSYCEMYFVTKLDSEGEALEPFSEAGLAVGIVPADYLGLDLYKADIAEGRIWLDLGLADLVNVGGHSYDDWVLRFAPVIQSIDSQGELLFNGAGFGVSNYHLGSLAGPSGYYRASRGNQNLLSIQKYGNNGQALWNATPLSDLSWYVSAYEENWVKLAESSDIGLILLARTVGGGMYHLTYCSLDQSGLVTSPVDRIIYSSYSADFYYDLLSTRMGTYFVINSKDWSYGGLQFRANGEEPILPPAPGHSFKLNKAYPNPFGGELKLDFDLETPGSALLEVFNLRGQRVLARAYRDLPAGTNEIVWDGRESTNRECGNGIYFIRISDGTNADVIRILRLK